MGQKVHFSSELIQVKTMYVWDFAYRQARKTTWQKDYCDRIRFNNRIRNANLSVGWIFDQQHRTNIKMYILRQFLKNTNKTIQKTNL